MNELEVGLEVTTKEEVGPAVNNREEDLAAEISEKDHGHFLLIMIVVTSHVPVNSETEEIVLSHGGTIVGAGAQGGIGAEVGVGLRQYRDTRDQCG